MRTIVVSAVNIRKGGTLTILKDCLSYLSSLTKDGKYRVVALVHQRSLTDYPGIEYIEFPDTIKNWGKRLWCEYFTMYRISQSLSPVYLWLSLHDTTPRVKAERQVLYCQTSFPFFKWKFRDFFFDYKIVLFALLTRFVYRINIHKNKYLIVQAEWLRTGFSNMFHLPKEKFIVATPEQSMLLQNTNKRFTQNEYSFLVASSPDCHKNFETVCQATTLLEKKVGKNKFKVILTIKGNENKYARWLYKNWGHISSIDFRGFMKKEDLYTYYASVNCLIFPSRIETWGLPISEFANYNKPMIIADLPYAYETAAGSNLTAFFQIGQTEDLADKMYSLLNNNFNQFHSIRKNSISDPCATTWNDLFKILLTE